MTELIGRPRLARGERFAVRDGLWHLALRAATERRSSPVAPGPLAPMAVATPQGRLVARVAALERDGSAAILLHGVIVSSRYLLGLGAELAAAGPVVVPDLPGYGLSEAPDRTPSLADLADAAVACATAAGHDRIALVGNSFGAQVAVEAALRHPERVERLVLLGPTVDPAARSFVPQVVRWLRNAPDEHLSVLPVMARDLVDVGVARAAALVRVMLEDAIEAKLPSVTAETLVVRGGRDRVVAQRWAEEAARLLPHGRVEVIPGYAHMPHWSGTLAVAPVIRAFLDEPAVA